MTYLLQTPDQLAVHLRALRLANGWSQKQLAEKLGLSQSRVARIERDPLSISVEQLLKVLSALGANVRIHVDSEGASPTQTPVVQVHAADTSGESLTSAAEIAFTKSERGDW
ncbi:helix-turn-helix transcriptional regulator [Rhodoferax sp.]|uniref:helix-turn-helix domain-containing protein n=1 Tax=Rhodoferax sp. TaxID=50421 RepID=UPI0025EE8606|nr:helix-turn-helix transcriptional regulator [Rhodoferax sp.]